MTRIAPVRIVSKTTQKQNELLLGQRVSDALQATLHSADILPANSESHERRQERTRLALHAVIDSVSAARPRRAAQARKYIAWQPGELCFYWSEGRGTVKLTGRRGAWCGPGTILMQERRRVGNVESMTGVVWLVHGKVLLRATPEQLRPATSAERVLGELQNTSLDDFTQVVNNVPKGEVR